MTVLIRRPRAVVFDILGTASKSGFLEKILFPFLKINLDNYIATHWANKEFKLLFKKILDSSIEFHKQEANTPVVSAYDNPNSRQSLLNFINFVTDNGINCPAVTHLRFKVWFEGYQQSKLRTPIYSDVPNQIRKWFAEGIKFYVFSNTWVEAQKALLRNTNHGDLTNLISGHYDNEFGSLLQADSWRRLCNQINELPENVLFLTKAPQEGRAAAEAGLGVVLVLTHRHNVKAVSHEDRSRFPYVRTLNDLAWTEDASTGQAPGSIVQAISHANVSGGGGEGGGAGIAPTSLSRDGASTSRSRNRQNTTSVPTAISVQTSAGGGPSQAPLVGSTTTSRATNASGASSSTRANTSGANSNQ